MLAQVTLKKTDFAVADAFELARWQRALDRQLTVRIPQLAAVKRERMLSSPHALFRGSAALFAELARARCDFTHLPSGRGVIVGDMHLENVGAYRSAHPARTVVFELNDFDAAGYGAHAFDVLRLAVSVLLSGRTFGENARDALSLLELGLEQYARVMGARGSTRQPPRPDAIEQLIARVEKRKPKDLLDQRAPLVAGRRRLVRGARYLDLPRPIAARAQQLLEAWLAALGSEAPKGAAQYRVIDAAQRVAGTGSLGVLRIAMLVDAGERELRIVELKQALDCDWSSWHEPVDPAQRVVLAARALVEWPMRRLAALPRQRVGNQTWSLFGRSLAPQEDKLELGSLDAWSEKEALIRLVFHLLGKAHRRAAEPQKMRTIRERELVALTDAAITLAGTFEGVALAYAHLE